jgi:glycosyltransferase involved in cell wall biosynthesis
LGTPALANAHSPVLKDHCRRSQAGLFYENADEFVESLALLEQRDELRAALAANGRRYVDAEYRWDRVLERYESLIAAVSAGTRA